MKGEARMFGRRHHHCGPIQIPGCHKVQCCPPVCHEPIQFVKENCITHVVPHVHPVQTLEVNNHVYQHQHHFPHSFQSTNTVTQQNQQMGMPSPPRPGCSGSGSGMGGFAGGFGSGSGMGGFGGGYGSGNCC